MIHFLYNLGIRFYGTAVQIAAILGQTKAQKWLNGRKGWRSELRELVSNNSRPIWIHAASLGEMEQGLPIVENLKRQFPQNKILITFFSPSGYENFKDHHLADFIFYLPLDTPANARDFVKICRPKLALFIKYEIWVNYFLALNKARVPLILAPALFRPTQVYFKPVAWAFFKKVFQSINHIMLQNQKSYKLLKKHGLKNISVCGDTRFDRVMALTQKEYEHSAKFKAFLGEKFCLIGGSSWPPEEEILEKSLKSRSDIKLILAPHLVNASNIERLEKEFEPYGLSRFSQENWNAEHRVLLVDNIGHLKMLYRFAHFALVGGGFGPGVHSTVEPVCYGLPVAFGPNHKKFVEPGEMIQQGVGFEIRNYQDFISVLSDLRPRDEIYSKTQQAIADYLSEKSGAVESITTTIIEILETNNSSR